jgi:hypothetical protein
VAFYALTKILLVHHLGYRLKLVEPGLQVAHTGFCNAFVVYGIHARNAPNGIIGRNGFSKLL